jgi:hypothetical protein
MTWTDIADEPAHNLLQALYADVPKPTEASRVCEWEEEEYGAGRAFWGAQRGTAVRIKHYGEQHSDGSVSNRAIFVNTGGGGIELTPAEALKVIDDLRAAIDEMDALAD